MSEYSNNYIATLPDIDCIGKNSALHHTRSIGRPPLPVAGGAASASAHRVRACAGRAHAAQRAAGCAI